METSTAHKEHSHIETASNASEPDPKRVGVQLDEAYAWSKAMHARMLRQDTPAEQVKQVARIAGGSLIGVALFAGAQWLVGRWFGKKVSAPEVALPAPIPITSARRSA